MKSIDLSAIPFKPRQGVRPGRYFTSKQIRKGLELEKERKEKRLDAIEMLAKERARFAEEREKRVRLLNALKEREKLGYSSKTPIKEAKDGAFFIQPNIKGHFGKRINLG